MRSLEYRLHIGLSLSLLVLFVLFGYLGQKSMRDMTENFVLTRMEHDIESLLAALEITNNSIHLQQNRMPLVYQKPYSGHYFMIIVQGHKTIYSRSLWDQSLTLETINTGDTKVQLTEGPNHQELLQINAAFNKKGMDLNIVLAEDLTLINQSKQEFITYFLILSFMGLVLLLFIQGLIIRLSFRRLEIICSDIQHLEDGEIVKLPEDVPSEILPLVHEVNHLLLLLEKRLERSRNALGNLSHALKSPLNLLYQYISIEPLEIIDTQATSNVNAKVQLQLERINQLIDRELKRARLAGRGGSSQRFEPARELPDLVQVIQQMHTQRKLQINLILDEQLTPFGDREDMLELIGNLLDNAGKWAKTTINITMTMKEGNRVELSIEDDGAGIKAEQLHSLAHRGVRLDESVEGHGLGLAIVYDIVKLYSASIQLECSSALGGLRVIVCFGGTNKI